jgi:hypothetical protein
MALKRASDRFTVRERSVHFLMEDDGAGEVICSISSTTLVAIGQAAGLSHPIFIFLAFREKIERAASEKYDRTARIPYEILSLQEHDLPTDVGHSILSHSAMR